MSRKHVRDLSPKGAKCALSRLKKNLPKLTAEEAHDRLVSILVRCMYDNDGKGFLWAHDLPIVKKIIGSKPRIKKYAFEWFVGVKK